MRRDHAKPRTNARAARATSLPQAVKVRVACGDLGSFTLYLPFSNGWSVTPQRSEDGFAEVGAEIRREGVFEPRAAGAITDQALQVPLVRPQAERQLAEAQAPVNREIVVDILGDPLATRRHGIAAVSVIEPQSTLHHGHGEHTGFT